MNATRAASKNADLKKIRAFLNDALNDYIAARVLLLSKLPQQGAVLSSTAIEKYFKVVLAFRGNESRGHLKAAHWKAVRNFDPKLFSTLDLSFLELNRKCYQLRYTDDIPVGFNLVISTREFLAELDHTALSIQRSFVLANDGKKQVTWFDSLLATRDDLLWRENHSLLVISKQQYIEQAPPFIYELRQDSARGLMEATYVAEGPPKVSGFLRPGFAPKDTSGMSYELAYGESGEE